MISTIINKTGIVVITINIFEVIFTMLIQLPLNIRFVALLVGER